MVSRSGSPPVDRRATPRAEKPSAAQRLGRSDWLLYLGLAALTAAAWGISRLGLFTSWSRTGYWIGVGGGVSLLLLFAYPLRKRWRLTYGWGAAKYWFVAHMVLGILGPWLILLHSTFQLRSLNAAVSLYSMLIVAFSGVIGRFLYVRIHRGLNGEKSSLAQLHAAVGTQHDAADTQLGSLPGVARRLHEFERQSLGADRGRHQHLWRLFVLPWRRRILLRACREEIKESVKRAARHGGWSKRRALHHLRHATGIAQDYTLAVQRVAQFQTFDYLFSLWHVAHVPFVWIMVICAVFHVVAVHAY